jgi:hypothetical protein
MSRYIEILEDTNRDIIVERFRQKIKHYRSTVLFFIFGDALVLTLVFLAYYTGRSNAMNIAIFIAVVAAFTIPPIMSSLNKIWQLGSDIESGRIQVVSGTIDKIKTETIKKIKYNIIFIERDKYRIDDIYCENIKENHKVNISLGISSKIPVSAVNLE